MTGALPTRVTVLDTDGAPSGAVLTWWAARCAEEYAERLAKWSVAGDRVPRWQWSPYNPNGEPPVATYVVMCSEPMVIARRMVPTVHRRPVVDWPNVPGAGIGAARRFGAWQDRTPTSGALPVDYWPRLAPRSPRLPNVPTRYPDSTRYAVSVQCSGTDQRDGWEVWQDTVTVDPTRTVWHTGRTDQRGGYVAGSGTESDPRKVRESVPAKVVDRRTAERVLRVEHHAWCGADGCDQRHKCFAAPAEHRDWQCTVHGAAKVVGCDLPGIVDDGTAERVRVTRYAPKDREVVGSVLVARGSVLVDADRGKVITDGSRKTYAGRSRGKRGAAVRPEPSEPTMASGKWRTRLRAATPDGSAVLVYRWSALAHPSYGAAGWAERSRYAGAPSIGPAGTVVVRTGERVRVSMTAHRGAYLLRVTTSKGTAVKRTPKATSMASLIARDARASEVVAVAVRRTRTERSRAATVAGATRRTRSAERVASLAGLADRVHAKRHASL